MVKCQSVFFRFWFSSIYSTIFGIFEGEAAVLSCFFLFFFLSWFYFFFHCSICTSFTWLQFCKVVWSPSVLPNDGWEMRTELRGNQIRGSKLFKCTTLNVCGEFAISGSFCDLDFRFLYIALVFWSNLTCSILYRIQPFHSFSLFPFSFIHYHLADWLL